MKTPSRMLAESDTRSVKKSCCTYRVATVYAAAYIKVFKKYTYYYILLYYYILCNIVYVLHIVATEFHLPSQ